MYPWIHFLAGSDTDKVTTAVIYGCGRRITSFTGNREILGMRKSIIDVVKKFRKSSNSDMVFHKLLSASPEMHPVPVLGWIVVQLCTVNRANIMFKKKKVLQPPTVNEL